MSGTPVQDLAGSAQKSGLSRSADPKAVNQTCPHNKGAGNHATGGVKEAVYEYCDLKELKLELTGGDKSHAMTLTKQRRKEAPGPSPPSEYQEALNKYDLVSETLADGRAGTNKQEAVTVRK